MNYTRERNQRAGFFVTRVALAAVLSGTIAACSIGSLTTALISPEAPKSARASDVSIALLTPPRGGTSAPAAPAHVPDPVPMADPFSIVLSGADEGPRKRRGYRTVGAPYQIAGAWYEPKEDPNYDRTGMASWYGEAFQGRMTANGEIFDSTQITAAHPTLPLPSYVRVTNTDNARSMIVRVNDRGPFRHKRLIDVSEEVAHLLGFHHAGMTKVRVEYVGTAPLEPESKSTLLASLSGPGVGASGKPIMLASLAPDLPAKQPAPQEEIVAFASDKPTIGDAAIRRLTDGFSAGDRILMAFDVVASLEQ